MLNPNIFLLGDIHGNADPVKQLYERNKNTIREHDILILLGDAGLNYYLSSKDNRVKDNLSSLPFDYFVVRGNHEERPSICAEKRPHDWRVEGMFNSLVWVEKKYPKIRYAMDFVNVYNIAEYQTLIIPGAYSVDKNYRLSNNWSWFPKEQLSQKEREEGLELIEKYTNKFDMVLSHTCPLIYEPTDLFLSVVDQSLVDKTMERYLNQIEKKIDYRFWLFGHYHSFRVYPKFGDSQVIMLFNDCGVRLQDLMEDKLILL